MSDQIDETADLVADSALDRPEVRAAALRPTPMIASTHPRIAAVAADVAQGAGEDVDVARRLYEFVRDGIPYGLAPGHKTHPAAWEVLDRPKATCIPKAALLAALARARGIPALLCFYDVRDHQIGATLRELLDTDTYPWHAVPRLRLAGRWVRLECSMNRALAERQGWFPVEFSTEVDALLRPETVAGARHWEVLIDHGTWTGFPLDRMRDGLARMYGSRRPPAEVMFENQP